MTTNLNDRVGLETSECADYTERAATPQDCKMVERFTKGQVLSMGREIPCVLDVPSTVREFYYQCLIRCEANGRIRSFSACARAAGISPSSRKRALKVLEEEIGLVYKSRKSGGGFVLEKFYALYQEACKKRVQFGPGGGFNLNPEEGSNWTPYKSLKKKKDTRVTREGSFFDDTRSRSSLCYRNARQSQGWVEEEESPIRPLMNTSMDFV